MRLVYALNVWSQYQSKREKKMTCAFPLTCVETGAADVCGGRSLRCQFREPVPVIKQYDGGEEFLVYMLDGVEVDYYGN